MLYVLWAGCQMMMSGRFHQGSTVPDIEYRFTAASGSSRMRSFTKFRKWLSTNNFILIPKQQVTACQRCSAFFQDTSADSAYATNNPVGGRCKHITHTSVTVYCRDRLLHLENHAKFINSRSGVCVYKTHQAKTSQYLHYNTLFTITTKDNGKDWQPTEGSAAEWRIVT